MLDLVGELDQLKRHRLAIDQPTRRALPYVELHACRHGGSDEFVEDAARALERGRTHRDHDPALALRADQPEPIGPDLLEPGEGALNDCVAFLGDFAGRREPLAHAGARCRHRFALVAGGALVDHDRYLAPVIHLRERSDGDFLECAFFAQ